MKYDAKAEGILVLPPLGNGDREVSPTKDVFALTDSFARNKVDRLVKLSDANIYSFADANIQAAAESCGKSGAGNFIRTKNRSK